MEQVVIYVAQICGIILMIALTIVLLIFIIAAVRNYKEWL